MFALHLSPWLILLPSRLPHSTLVSRRISLFFQFHRLGDGVSHSLSLSFSRSTLVHTSSLQHSFYYSSFCSLDVWALWLSIRKYFASKKKNCEWKRENQERWWTVRNAQNKMFENKMKKMNERQQSTEKKGKKKQWTIERAEKSWSHRGEWDANKWRWKGERRSKNSKSNRRKRRNVQTYITASCNLYLSFICACSVCSSSGSDSKQTSMTVFGFVVARASLVSLRTDFDNSKCKPNFVVGFTVERTKSVEFFFLLFSNDVSSLVSLSSFFHRSTKSTKYPSLVCDRENYIKYKMIGPLLSSLIHCMNGLT